MRTIVVLVLALSMVACGVGADEELVADPQTGEVTSVQQATITAPRDAASGLATGKRTHKP